ncbi:hypothetical protein DRO91_08785 [Candidatus Heimdallarchaeota archaeon]|nr:MAG: hypothetical protein DRO91_08785 [Candidatus Heimdallarchaeota archaeon]
MSSFVRIVNTTGVSNDTKVINQDTGEEIPHIRGIVITCEIDEIVTAEIETIVTLDLLAQIPRTERSKELLLKLQKVLKEVDECIAFEQTKKEE